MIKRMLMGAAALAMVPALVLAQVGGGGGNVNNAVGVWGQDTGTGLPCIIAPAGGSATCKLPSGPLSGSVSIAPTGLTTTNASGTITTGGTFQSILAANAARIGCLVQNPTTASEPLYVFFGANASATTGKSISLSPGASVSCAVGGLGVATDNVSATATTTAHPYVEMSQ